MDDKCEPEVESDSESGILAVFGDSCVTNVGRGSVVDKGLVFGIPIVDLEANLSVGDNAVDIGGKLLELESYSLSEISTLNGSLGVAVDGIVGCVSLISVVTGMFVVVGNSAPVTCSVANKDPVLGILVVALNSVVVLTADGESSVIDVNSSLGISVVVENPFVYSEFSEVGSACAVVF